MAYGIKYTCDFDRVDTGVYVSYTIQILQKDYAGSVTAVTGGASPAVHTWETDDPKAPIKGSSLVISLINEGNLPLSDFYSEDDDEFKIILLWNTQKMFEGFIVQDDSSEIMVEYNHEISLSANDNLGLLKDVSFGAALERDSVSVYDRLFLLDVIKLCINSTGIPLNTRVIANINEESRTNTVCFLEQIMIDPQTFFNGTSSDDCYSVLEKILTRFNCSLFQSKGFWNIVRLDEARYYDYDAPGHEYDTDFLLVGDTALDWSNSIFGGFAKFVIGIGELAVAETGLQQRITRPFKYTKETFNFKQPEKLLRNYDLQELGTLITTYTTGSGTTLKTFNEYEVPWWDYTNAAPTPTGVNGAAVYFIRTVHDSVGNEIERYLVVKNNGIHSYPIEAQTGDIIRFSFSVYQSDSFTTVGIFMKLTDGTTTVYAHEKPASPGWAATTGSVSVQITPFEWSSVDFETGPIPFDGLLTLYVTAISTPATNENLYRDIRIDYIPIVNQSTKIIGQTHTSEQTINVKNTEDHEIFMDNSPRNSLAGTLFLDHTTGVLQDRAKQWKRSYLVGAKNLGEITTFENLFLRRIPRTLLEGTFYGLTTLEGDHLSILNVCQYTYFPDKTFVFGRLEIDYRNNQASGTLFELYKSTEVDADLVSDYIFNYLYAPK